MSSENAKKRLLTFGIILPFLFVAPEVINLGAMFLRWDYLIFFVFILNYLNNKSTQCTFMTAWSKKTNIIVLAYTACTALMIWRLSGDTELIEGLKYAAWPMKSIFWGIGFYLVLHNLKGSATDIYRMLTTMAILVFVMQLFELLLPSFRDFIFEYYPVVAEERLRDLDYRARGPFNGYDLTSLFFAVVCIYINEYSKYYNIKSSGTAWRIVLTIAGAYISARTGLLLIIGYLFYSYLSQKKWQGKTGLIFLVSLGIVFLPGFISIDEADDSNLFGRYLEIVQAMASGDVLMIQSFSGTFAMNALLLAQDFNPIWGSGLTVDTTADQLYFKYFYMFGFVGLVIWIIFHVSIYLICRSGNATHSDQRVYRYASLAVVVLIAIAHIKGGNYFFSTRLGDLVAMLLVLATLTTKENIRNK